MADFKKEIFRGKQIQLGYYFFEGGENLLVLFPGYGQSARHFVYFNQHLKSNYSILGINHLEHGDSLAFKKDEPLEINEFNATLFDLIHFLGFENRNIVMGAFSFGNWLAAAAIQSQSFPVKGWIVMSAPPVRFSRLFAFSTGTILGKLIFRFYTKENIGLQKILNFIKNTKILSEEKIRVASLQVKDSSKSRRLYNNWQVMRHFIPNWRNCIKLAQTKQIEILFVAGKHDNVTPMKGLLKLFQAEKSSRILVFNGAHTFMHEDIIEGIDKFLNEIDNKQKIDLETINS
ncbi:MAG: alpha/beta fold hydrolase [Bacteroidia bacterium]